MLKYTVSLYTSIPFGLKALYRNIIIPQNENERERNTDIRLIKHLNGHLPNAHNTIPAAHKTSIGIFKKKGRGGKSAIRTLHSSQKRRKQHFFKQGVDTKRLFGA